MHNQLLIQERYINNAMEDFKILNQKPFESTKKFERRLNEVCSKGWKPVSLTGSQMGLTALLEKVDRYNSY